MSVNKVVISFIFGTIIRYMYVFPMPVKLQIAFDSVPNMSIYGHFFILLCIYCDIAEKNDLVLFIFGTVIRYHVLRTHVN